MGSYHEQWPYCERRKRNSIFNIIYYDEFINRISRIRICVIIAGITFTGDSKMDFSIQELQQGVVRLVGKDANGRTVPVEGIATWDSSNPEVLSEVPSLDTLSANITAGIPGVDVLSASLLTTDNRTLTASSNVTVTAIPLGPLSSVEIVTP